MSDASGPTAVIDERAHHRFVHRPDTSDRADDIDAELVYELDDDRLVLIHTGVDESLRGQGVGERLVMAAVDRARAGGLTIVPWCPYARHWLREHPDVARTVRIDWATAPPSSDEGAAS